MAKVSGTIFINQPTLSAKQFHILASFCKELAQAAVVGAFGTLIIPSAFGLKNKISFISFLFLILGGLTSLIAAVILEKEVEK